MGRCRGERAAYVCPHTVSALCGFTKGQVQPRGHCENPGVLSGPAFCYLAGDFASLGLSFPISYRLAQQYLSDKIVMRVNGAKIF